MEPAILRKATIRENACVRARSGPTRCLRFHLTRDESQQISVDALRIDDRNTVGDQ
jgi:hypothetical protein